MEVQLYTSNISASVAIDGQDGKELQLDKIGLPVRVSLTCCRKITKTEHASLFKNTQQQSILVFYFAHTFDSR